MLGENEGPDELPLSAQLLEDIRTVFGDAEQIGTVDLVEALCTLPGGRWASLWPSPVAAPKELSGLLGPLGVIPVRIRVDGHQVRGYVRSIFEPLWVDLVTDDVSHLAPEDVSQAA